MGKIKSSRPPKDTWEEQLYMSVTKQLWKQLSECNNNNCIHLYPNVARWNDAAAKEAFEDAKARFFARTNNVPCDVAPPDHEFYLDKVDWKGFEDDIVPEMDEVSSVWGSEGGVEGFEVMLDASFGVGWGPEEWYETKKEEEVKKDEGKVREEAGGIDGGGGRRRRRRGLWLWKQIK